MTDHPDPTALRLEGQRLVEAMDRAAPWDYPTLADAYDNALAALTKAEQERDEAVFMVSQTTHNLSISAAALKACNEQWHAQKAKADAAEARAAAMEAALEEISGHAPVKTPPDYATSSDTGEAFDDGYSRGVWEMGQIADAALAQPGTGGAT